MHFGGDLNGHTTVSKKNAVLSAANVIYKF